MKGDYQFMVKFMKYSIIFMSFKLVTMHQPDRADKTHTKSHSDLGGSTTDEIRYKIRQLDS